MKLVMLIAGIFWAIIFVLPLFQIFSMSTWGWFALVLLGVSNYLYLLSKSANLAGLIKCSIPLVLLLLYFLCIKNWADHQTGYPLGIGLAAAFLVMAGIAVFVFWQEIVTIKHLVPDLMNLITSIRNWQGTGKDWLALVVLIPLGTHLYVLHEGGLSWYNGEPDLNPVIIKVQNKPVDFKKRGLRIEGAFFHRTIREGILTNPTEFTVGKETVLFRAGKGISFFADGSIEAGSLEKAAFLMVRVYTKDTGEDVRVLFAADYPMEFCPDGNVKKGLLAQDLDLTLKKSGRRITVPKGSGISFFLDGSPQTIELYEGLFFETGLGVPILMKEVTLFQDGTVASGCLAQDSLYEVGEDKIVLKNGCEVIFDENGLLKQGTLAKDFIYSPLGCVLKEGYKVLFYKNGSLKRATLAQDYTYSLKEIVLEKGWEAVFYEDGSLKYGTLATEIVLMNIVLPEGTRIYLGRQGELLGLDYFSHVEFYFKPDGKILCKRGNGTYIYRGEKLYINDNDSFVQYKNKEIGEEDFDRDDFLEVNALGYHYRKSVELMRKNGIELLPEFEDTVLPIMFRFKDYKKKIICDILFLEEVIISYRGEKITCPPYEWVSVQE